MKVKKEPEVWVITYNFSTMSGSVSHLSLGCYFDSEQAAKDYMDKNHMSQEKVCPYYRAEKLEKHLTAKPA